MPVCEDDLYPLFILSSRGGPPPDGRPVPVRGKFVGFALFSPIRHETGGQDACGPGGLLLFPKGVMPTRPSLSTAARTD